ncbi:nucleotide sugar dehydrogenase [Halorutilus salinus]|uniref:nucleotide sugar dehydrogenase n=1 Tax=Halorutilus salinus TaxID=2487751 RepID=UPI0023EEC924|nr:nucleotide sugar dehydrogenase [Halorutilus salinus]
MKVSVIGSGYVGTTVAVCLAELGHEVVNVDIDGDTVASMNNGVAPIHEPRLGELVEEHAESGALRATTEYDAVRETDVTLICLPTPSRDDGAVDTSVVEEGARSVGEALAGKDGYHVVGVKSTVVPGTVEDAVVPAVEEASDRSVGDGFGVVSNPEFLREGTAVDDFLDPDKVVVGASDGRARDVLRRLYEPLLERSDAEYVETGVREAETIKYANNAFLASKLSVVNEIANVCKEAGVDSYEVMDAVGIDHRISSSFTRSGLGWGGSCLTGDERVIVKDNGETEHTTLAEFYGEYAANDELDDVSVLSRGDDGSWAFKPVVAATRREYDGELHTFHTSMNKTVTVTHDHPMLTVENGETVVCEARDLSEGDALPVLDSIPEDSVGAFDLIGYAEGSSDFDEDSVYLKPTVDLKEHKDELRDALSEYNEAFGYDRVHEFVRNGYLSLDAFLAAEDELPLCRTDVALYTTVGGGQTYVPAVLDADEDFWRFIGYYISEGHVADDDSGHGSKTRRRVFLSFHPSDEQEYVEDVTSYLDRIGVRHKTRTKETTTDIEVSSRVLAGFLEHIGCGTDSYTARIPDAAYDEPAQNRLALLSGLFRGDGHVEYTNHSNAVVYDYGSVSEELIQGMQVLLHSLGIVPSYKSSRSEKSTQMAHFLRVSSKGQVAALKDIYLPSERERIERRLNSYDREVAPMGYAADGGMTTVSVRDTVVEEETTDVYSLEVEDSHNFVTTDGLVVHNCFPKDVDALRSFARSEGYETELLDAVVDVNDRQAHRAVELLRRHVELDGARVAVLGLAFKPQTDDVRNSRALDVIRLLDERGADVVAYDPEATENARRALDIDVEYADSAQDAVEDAAGIVIATDWDEFEGIDASGAVVVDGRRVEVRNAEVYEGLCW